MVKTRLSTASNILGGRLLGTENLELDSEISYYASKVLSDSEIMVYQYLFECDNTFEEVRDKVNQRFKKNYSIATICKYRDRGIERLVNNLRKGKGKTLLAYFKRVASGDKGD